VASARPSCHESLPHSWLTRLAIGFEWQPFAFSVIIGRG
jgi:hypothetical protein